MFHNQCLYPYLLSNKMVWSHTISFKYQSNTDCSFCIKMSSQLLFQPTNVYISLGTPRIFSQFCCNFILFLVVSSRIISYCITLYCFNWHLSCIILSRCSTFFKSIPCTNTITFVIVSMAY